MPARKRENKNPKNRKNYSTNRQEDQTPSKAYDLPYRKEEKYINLINSTRCATEKGCSPKTSLEHTQKKRKQNARKILTLVSKIPSHDKL